MAAVPHVKTSDFKAEVLQSKLPVLVDFFAVWCGPCSMFAPELEKLADELKGKVKVVKVNVDEEPKLAETFGVQSIPTLFLLKDGKPLDQMVGVHAGSDIALWIKNLLA